MNTPIKTGKKIYVFVLKRIFRVDSLSSFRPHKNLTGCRLSVTSINQRVPKSKNVSHTAERLSSVIARTGLTLGHRKDTGQPRRYEYIRSRHPIDGVQ